MNILLWVLAGPRRAPVRSVGRHEGLHVRQGKRGGRVLWCVAAGSLEGPWHPRTRLHGRADRPRRPPLAAGAHGGGRRVPDDREPRVRLGARQVPRDHAHHLKRPAGSPHGVHRVRPDGPEADLLNGGPSHKG